MHCERQTGHAPVQPWLANLVGYEVEILNSLESIPSTAWNILAPSNNPFLHYHFLRGLEVSRCVGTVQTGWVPRHVVVRDGETLVGAMPLYEKYDSYGEYIFDWSWARAAQQAGISYYPKLVSAVPFTPVTGPRMLVDPNCDETNIQAALLSGMNAVLEKLNASGLHILFSTAAQSEKLAEFGMHPRLSHQFHWRRRDNWLSFEDYIGDMKAKRRKQIKRERRKASSHGLRLSMVCGTQLSHEDWQALYLFYRTTCHHKGAIPYLTPEFFEYLKINMPEQILVSMAFQDNVAVAASIFFRGEENLFGRYWGCLENFDHLHFELCYYLPIEWSLQNGITRIEAGAQGPHKISRGFDAEICHSTHHLTHQGLAQAVKQFLVQEATSVRQEVKLFRDHSPFKMDSSVGSRID